MRKTCLLLISLLVLTGFTVDAYVLNCPGTIYYNTYQEITYSDCVNSSYWEVGPDYFILSDMNFTIDNLASHFCDYNLSFFNDTFSNHSSIPYRFFEFNATYSFSGSDSFILDMPNSYFKIDMLVNNILTDDDVEEMEGLYTFPHSFPGVSQVYSFWIDSYIPECPTGGNSTYDPVSNTVNFTWSNTSRTDSFVLVRNYNSYPSSISDGTIVQNNSMIYYNTSLSNETFFSLWTYNLSSNTFSSNSCKLDLEWGAITIYGVKNKSATWKDISPFSILISDEDGTDTYWNISATTPLYISKDDIPFGTNTVITINASGYKSSQYYFDYEVNNFYNHTFYLSPEVTVVDPGTGDAGDTNDSHLTSRLYRIRVIDTYQTSLSSVTVNVKFYSNTTDTYENTSILLTDGYGEADVYLVPSVNYKIFLTKTGYSQVGSKDWIPDPVFYGANYPKIFQMTVDIDEDTTIWSGINWSIEPTIFDHYTNFTLFYNISSENNDLEYYTMIVYLWNSTSESWIVLSTQTDTTSSGGSLSYTTVNGTGRYAVECSFKREDYDLYNFGTPHSDEKYVYNIFDEGSDGASGITIDDALTGVVGASPVFVGDVFVAYSSLIACFVAMVALFTLSPKFAGFAIILLGIVIAAFKQPLGIISDDVMNFTVAAGIIILGIITIYAMKKGGK